MAIRPRIILTRRWPDAVERRLCERYDVRINEQDIPMSAEQLREAIRSCDALCPTVSDVIDRSIIEAPGAAARIIGNYGVGTNHIDLDAAQRAGMAVTNTPDVLTDATADLAILLMLMATRRAGEGERELRAGRWSGWRPTHLLGLGLQGKRLGLIGFGRIAQATAMRARAAFGMRIAYYSRRAAPPEVEAALGAEYFPALKDLVAASDVISLHCPGVPETHHLINADMLARMKPDAVLVNTARGTVVDEAALAKALAEGRIAAAGLDVYEQEPKVHPALLALENVVLLPHLGSATRETRVAMGMRVADNLDRFFAGEAPTDRVV